MLLSFHSCNTLIEEDPLNEELSQSLVSFAPHGILVCQSLNYANYMLFPLLPIVLSLLFSLAPQLFEQQIQLNNLLCQLKNFFVEMMRDAFG